MIFNNIPSRSFEIIAEIPTWIFYVFLNTYYKNYNNEENISFYVFKDYSFNTYEKHIYVGTLDEKCGNYF